MANKYSSSPCPCYGNIPMYPGNMGNLYPMYGYPPVNTSMYNYAPYSVQTGQRAPVALRDYGPEPFAVNITEVTKRNNNYRTALWSGCHLQLTLMSIEVGGDIGLEVHPRLDQFIRIEEGQGLLQMGPNKYNLNFQRNVCDDFAIFIPAGTWHNVINTGVKPIKLYSIYAPPNHPHGIVQRTKPVNGGD